MMFVRSDYRTLKPLKGEELEYHMNGRVASQLES